MLRKVIDIDQNLLSEYLCGLCSGQALQELKAMVVGWLVATPDFDLPDDGPLADDVDGDAVKVRVEFALYLYDFETPGFLNDLVGLHHVSSFLDDDVSADHVRDSECVIGFSFHFSTFVVNGRSHLQEILLDTPKNFETSAPKLIIERHLKHPIQIKSVMPEEVCSVKGAPS